MSDINIPGVSDKYKTNDLVKSLIEVERIPLKRQQEKLESYKVDKECWQRVNQHMTSLRETCRTLYSYDNPFNDKLASSTDEFAITATPTRDANIESFKIDVEKIATADRFLSGEIDKNTKVPQGKYVYALGEKSVTLNWKGGTVKDFVSALNKRSNGIIKAAVVGVSDTKQTMLIESLKTGKDNKLQFKEAALDFAINSEMLRPTKSEVVTLSQGKTLTPETSMEFSIPSQIQGDINQKIEFTIKTTAVTDVTSVENSLFDAPVLPDAQKVEFQGITIRNDNSETTLPAPSPKEPRSPITDDNAVFMKYADGSVKLIDTLGPVGIEKKIQISLKDYENGVSISVVNKNTGKEVLVSKVESYNANSNLGYEPINPVTVADDARLKYEGITITRSDNKIDDIVPNVTLNLEAATEKTATISIKPNTEAAKNAIIQFVGKYNQLMAELNILTQNKPEIVAELEYFTDDEKESANERLGKFQGEFSLRNEKSTLQRIINTTYLSSDDNDIKILAQLGISSKSGTASASISQSQMRGYLEINEKKLDEALDGDINQIKELFGFDSDEDMVIDNGIAYQLDKNLQSYVQIGGILASKTQSIDNSIKNTETQIEKLETQIAIKEMDLKRKYGQMESTLNNLESQKSTINNFNKQYDN